jgi:hypothetical protein
MMASRKTVPRKKSRKGRLIAKGCSWAKKLLCRHEARVGRVAKRLLQPPHKLSAARFKQLMREG